MRSAARLAAVCLVALGPSLLAQSDAELFAEANDAFRQANELRPTNPDQAAELYRRAALRYDRLLGEREISNSKLYCNLANAYFQAGDIGRAILNYRKAERLDPGDPNVQRNLAFARTKRFDKLDPASGGQVIETLLFWHFEWSKGTRMRLFAGAWILMWAVLALRRFGQYWAPREIAAGMAVAALLLAGSMAFESWDEAGSVDGVIVSPDTVARQGDGPSYEPAFREPLHAGTEFSVLEERPGWCHVELPDGRVCWLDSSDVAFVR